jgi:hypothetical protein
MSRIDLLGAPLLVSWQITRDCDLCCLHCCTDSAPGKRLPDELSAHEAMQIANDIARNEVPYVMLCGGEPLVVPHFLLLGLRQTIRRRDFVENLGQPAVRAVPDVEARGAPPVLFRILDADGLILAILVEQDRRLRAGRTRRLPEQRRRPE